MDLRQSVENLKSSGVFGTSELIYPDRLFS